MRYILVSACLMGINCRYDGGNNRRENVLALLQEKDICLIPVCPEQLGGMSTPRLPSERQNDRVIQKSGTDVTDFFESGAREALRIAKLWDCDTAILKAKSPSCGCGNIYDGTFSHTLTAGNGCTAEALLRAGIKVFDEKMQDFQIEVAGNL